MFKNTKKILKSTQKIQRDENGVKVEKILRKNSATLKNDRDFHIKII